MSRPLGRAGSGGLPAWSSHHPVRPARPVKANRLPTGSNADWPDALRQLPSSLLDTPERDSPNRALAR
jgi:hypothetical protein